MTQKLVKVRLVDFDVKALRAATREGRLYIRPKEIEASAEDLLLHCQQEAMEYVQAIDEFVTDEWRPRIKKLWAAISSDTTFAPMLVMQKGRMQGHLNRYTITNIVAHMMALKIYQGDNLLVLHKKLEGTNTKNGIYKGAGAYCLCRSQRQKLNELIQNVVV